ncbi:MAG: M42 family peptidase [Clostridia bacterium]|nr:M42 family peptidase [Clostridia bacterium]
MDIFETVKKIAAIPSVSGNEEAALPLYKALLSPYTDNVFADSFGNIKAVFGNGDILLEAHADKIGMIVTHVYDEGFLKVAPVGGIDARVLPAGDFRVLTADGEVYGTAASVPPHLADADDDKKAKPVDETLLDVGKDAAKKVRLGDRVMYGGAPVKLANDRICSPYLDNSIGCVTILLAAEKLAEKGCLADITLCFTAQEETGLRGAGAAVYGENHNEVVVVDTTFADAPGIAAEHCGKLGGGPMIGFSPVLPALFSRYYRNLAEKLGIPHGSEVMGRSTGTNADVISKAGEGFRTALLSVPIRNMHTPSEICDVRDVENTATLIAEGIIRWRTA